MPSFGYPFWRLYEKKKNIALCAVPCTDPASGAFRMQQLFSRFCRHGWVKKSITLNEVAHSIFYAPMYVAIEEGYFADEGLDVTLVTGFGADKTMTAVLTGEADIGFMGSESTIYTYAGGASDYVLNFAQLTQRAGNFLVSREPIDDFQWDMLKGKTILGGRAGGMPEMVFEYILKKNNIDPKTDLSIDQSIDFGSTAAAFSGGQGDFSVVIHNLLLHYTKT